MKHTLLFLLVSLICINISFSQVKTVDYSTISKTAQFQFLPDVDGKVLVSENMFDNIKIVSDFDLIELYPDWPLQYNGSSQRGGIYCNMDSDDDLEIVYNVTQQVYAWNIDGSIVEGWPVTVQLYPDGAPAFGDIDGDGIGEIVVSTRQSGTGNTGRLHAFNLDGSAVDGFPIVLTGGTTKTPVLADLNGDDILEIIIEERAYPDGYVGVYLGNGNAYPGFPVMLDYIPASAVAVGDITGDNIPEIIAESYYSIYAFDINGNILEGFPFTPGTGRVFSYSSPVLADLDGDGKREIIAGDHATTEGNGAVHILKYDGSIFPGWPQYTNYWVYGPPAVADIDGDGGLDIAVGDQVLSLSGPISQVFAWDKDGNSLAGWPTGPIEAINNQIIIADLDGDSLVELMWDDNTNAGVYIGYNHDGTPMEDWPLSVTGSTFFMNPFVADINNDGMLDISGASSDLTGGDIYFYLWNANVPVNEDLAKLPILQYNVQHTGVYVDATTLSADFMGSPLIICEQEEVQFTDQSNGNVDSWEWTFIGGYPESSVEQNPIIWYGDDGEYDVTLTISDGSDSQTITKTDYIKVATDPAIPDQPIGPTDVITSQTPFTFYETASSNASNYSWKLEPENLGLIVAGDTLTQAKVYWEQSNSYVAHLSVKSENVCGESEYSEVLDIFVNWNTDIQESIIGKPFKVIPNPNNGQFTLQINNSLEIVEISLINSMGIKIYQNNLKITEEQGVVEVDQNNLTSGIYFIKIETENKQYFEKIMIY